MKAALEFPPLLQPSCGRDRSRCAGKVCCVGSTVRISRIRDCCSARKLNKYEWTKRALIEGPLTTPSTSTGAQDLRRSRRLATARQQTDDTRLKRYLLFFVVFFQFTCCRSVVKLGEVTLHKAHVSIIDEVGALMPLEQHPKGRSAVEWST